MFHIGQRVICVDASPSHLPHPLVQGNEYIIAGFDTETEPTFAGILIEGWDHPQALFHEGRIGFKPSRFRPVLERKTDISIFTSMLHPQKEQV